MGNPSHLKVVSEGEEAVDKWRRTKPHKPLDLTGEDLRGLPLKRCNLDGANLNGANLSGMDLEDTVFEGADLSPLKDDETGEEIKTNLEGATISGANFNKANLSFVRCRGVKGSAKSRDDKSRVAMSGATITSADFRDAELEWAHFHHSKCSATDFRGAHLANAQFENVDLEHCDLTGADLRRARLVNANLTDTTLAGVDFFEAEVTFADFTEAKGCASARNLDKTIVSGDGVKYLSSCTLGIIERQIDWERIKVFGRLPLFGASYAALILIPIFMFCLAFYNDKVDLINAWAHEAVASNDGQIHRIAEIITEKRLERQPIPSRSMLLLISTLLLAAASTIYALACPSRVKEFSRDQWCDQLKNSLIHYWPKSWRLRWLRIVCAACYFFGGLGALYVLGAKVLGAGIYIFKNSTLSHF